MRKPTPDRDVVDAGVAQDPLTDGQAQNLEFLHQQDQDRQRGHRAGHADADHELPRHAFRPDPAIETEHAQRHRATEQQRHSQREPGGDRAFPLVHPCLAQIQLDPGDAHKQHHGPPGHAIERGHDVFVEHKGVVIGKRCAEHTRSEQDAGDDLHHHQRREIIGAPEPPDQIRHREDDGHRDEEDFGGGDGVRHARKCRQDGQE
jgi:hypothetical protein